jgi:hypothetical protein
MSAIEGWSPTTKVLPPRKNLWNAESVSPSASIAAFYAFSLSAGVASLAPTSPAYCGKLSAP